MLAREEGGLEAALAKAEQVTGISFKTSFSFAITAHLLKGLRAPATKMSTARVLSMFVDTCAKKSVGANLLGYLSALLPIQGEEMEIDHIRQMYAPSSGVLCPGARTEPSACVAPRYTVCSQLGRTPGICTSTCLPSRCCPTQ